jgi:hypothetical protein
MKTIRGKYLVRVASNANGQKKIIICGIFDPIDFDIESIDTRDEMWVSDLLVMNGGVKFTGKCNGALSPEDFLEGEFHSPSFWSNREEL